VGLFKGMKDMAGMTKQAKELQRKQQEEAGYKPGFGGQMAQMGDMMSQANETLAELNSQQGDEQRILAEGIAGTAVIVGMGTPARGAQQFNLDLDLEVHVSGRAPYRVANQYIVPASAPLGQGVTLPVKVDPNDQAKIAIDWDNVATGPARGEVRPVGGGEGFPPAPGPASSSGDSVAELERLAKLRDSGALTDAEFEQQKAKILGG
jgi:putative oligomerization/nucleic acid binding protein